MVSSFLDGVPCSICREAELLTFCAAPRAENDLAYIELAVKEEID